MSAARVHNPLCTPAARFLLPFLLLLLAGCITPDARDQTCPTLPADGVVDDVRGTDIVIDDGSLILHTSKATIFLRDGDCTPIDVEEVRPGDRVGHNAEQIATSYPAQAWPTTIVIERG